MTAPLAITACDLLTPLDSASASTWLAIRASQRVQQVTTIDPSFLHDADSHLDRSIQLALAVARRAAAQTPIAADTALFCGTSKGPIATYLAGAERVRNLQPLAQSQAAHVALGVGAMAPLVACQLHLKGSTHTTVAACASGLHALHRAARALQHNECRRALVLAADASVHPLFEASFQRLGVLAPLQPDGTRHCHPFTDVGAGFFLIEAAAALLIERSETLTTRPIAWLENSWIGADASALIAIDPHTRALRHGLTAMRSAAPSFIHAHATGTTHDAFERDAIHAVAGKNIPLFSSKKNLGHSLGAAGLVSVALSAQCHQHQMTLEGGPIPAAATSLTIAQGFGGHIGIVRLRSA